MKKRVLILVLLAVLVCLAGCGKKAELTVYVVDTEPLYVAALETFQTANPDVNLVVEKFSDYAAMNDRLNTELMSGKGPDVLLLNSYQSDLDAGKLAQSGAFLPLDDFMAELDGGSYYTVITDAGKVDGKQYLLPLSWNVLQAYCSADLPTKQGLDLDNLYDAFLRQAEKLAGQDDMAISSLQVNRTDFANYFLEVAGVSLTDGKTVTADKAQVDEVMAFVKMFYDNAGGNRRGDKAVQQRPGRRYGPSVLPDGGLFLPQQPALLPVRLCQAGGYGVNGFLLRPAGRRHDRSGDALRRH